jgi:hypothetical protein
MHIANFFNDLQDAKDRLALEMLRKNIPTTLEGHELTETYTRELNVYCARYNSQMNTHFLLRVDLNDDAMFCTLAFHADPTDPMDGEDEFDYEDHFNDLSELGETASGMRNEYEMELTRG